MPAETTWHCFTACADEASATAIVEYLRLNDCPAVVFPSGATFELAPPFEVRTPMVFLHRARWLWALADAQPELTEGELEYLATGKLPGSTLEEPRRDDAA
jgi:hypothetical protein